METKYTAQVAVAAAAAALVASTVGATAAHAQPPAPVAPLLPTTYTAKAGLPTAQVAALTIAGGKNSKLAVKGNALTLTLANADNVDSQNAAGRVSAASAKKIAIALKAVGGARGIIAGSKGSKSFATPVVFVSASPGKKGAVIVRATKVAPGVPSAVSSKLPSLRAVSQNPINGTLTSAGVHADTKGKGLFNFAGAGKGGVTKNSVSFSGGAYGVGVQSAGSAAGVTWKNLAANWAKVSKGVAPRLTIAGTGSDSKPFSVVFSPSKLSVAGSKVSFAGSLKSKLAAKQLSKLKNAKSVSVLLVASNPGSTKSYVVITGDSIASGVGSRWLNTMPGTIDGFRPVGIDPFDGAPGTCLLADRDCTSVESKGLNPITEDPTWAITTANRSYLPGTDKQGGCLRGTNAPGTWLARYLATQKNAEIEAINVACANAATKNVRLASSGGVGQNGEAPQADQLRTLANWLPIAYVTNTMGAEDIQLQKAMFDCFYLPASKLLGGGGNITTETAGPLAGGLVDAPWNPAYNSNLTCSADLRSRMQERTKTVSARVKSALTDLRAAAPGAELISTDYPNLIGNPQTSVINRRDFENNFLVKVLLASANEDSDFLDNVPDGPAVSAAVIANVKPANRIRAAEAYAGFILTGVISAYTHSGDLLYGDDQAWLANNVVPSLNDAVAKGAKEVKGVTVVDMGQLFNGRTWATAYATTLPDQVTGSNGSGGYRGYSHKYQTVAPADEGNPYTANTDPKNIRAEFASGPYNGLALPLVCLRKDTLSVNNSFNFVYDNPDSPPPGGNQCLGQVSEAFQPNWRGQAAQGQSLVAVVTKMVGTGGSCVRSVGDNEGAIGVTDEQDLANEKVVEGADKLCVVVTNITPSISDPKPADCTSGLSADPTWDTAVWNAVVHVGDNFVYKGLPVELEGTPVSRAFR